MGYNIKVNIGISVSSLAFFDMFTFKKNINGFSEYQKLNLFMFRDATPLCRPVCAVLDCNAYLMSLQCCYR
jgi:hypothetical protein